MNAVTMFADDVARDNDNDSDNSIPRHWRPTATTTTTENAN